MQETVENGYLLQSDNTLCFSIHVLVSNPDTCTDQNISLDHIIDRSIDIFKFTADRLRNRDFTDRNISVTYMFN